MTYPDSLDDLDQLRFYDPSGYLQRAEQVQTWPIQAEQAAKQWLAENHVATRARPSAIWLDLPPDLVPVGQIAAWMANTLYDLPVAVWHPNLRHHSGAQGGIRLTAHPITPGDAGSLSTYSLSPYLRADQHPVESVLFVAAILLLLNGYSTDDAAMAPQIHSWQAAAHRSAWVPAVPTVDNPAKQMAATLFDRVPIFWGDGICAAIAGDWALRRMWYAEAIALAASGSDMARQLVMARLPRYWPNISALVQLTFGRETHFPLADSLSSIFERRRFATYMTSAPAHLPPLASALYLLEYGEWIALYAAALNNVNPAERVPHQILF